VVAAVVVMTAVFWVSFCFLHSFSHFQLAWFVVAVVVVVVVVAVFVAVVFLSLSLPSFSSLQLLSSLQYSQWIHCQHHHIHGHRCRW